MLGDPVGDALGEGVVIKRVAEIGDRAFDLQNLVDGAGVAAALAGRTGRGGSRSRAISERA